MKTNVPAAEANRKFSELLRGVRKGRSYVVTSHGQPVAMLIPAEKDEDVAARSRARLLARLKQQPAVPGSKARRRWTREELYEDSR